MRLLLVEDDPMIGEDLEEALRAETHAVDWVRDGHAASLALDTLSYDLVLLDLGLPRRDGLEVLARYRQRGGSAPVLVVSARETAGERVRGLDAGADDYLIKPFDVHELLARVRALLRRNSGHGSSCIVHGGLSLDTVTHEASFRGEPLELSAREFALLAALLDPPGAVVSKARLEESIYGWSEEVESNTVEVFIYRLRRKLGNDFIRNVRGVGYRTSNAT